MYVIGHVLFIKVTTIKEWLQVHTDHIHLVMGLQKGSSTHPNLEDHNLIRKKHTKLTLSPVLKHH